MLEERILADFKDAMKKRDSIKTSTLSLLRAQLKNAAIEKKKDSLDDNEAIPIIKKQVKQRLESIETFKSGGRMDLADKEQKELEVLQSYLPQALSKDALEKIIDDVIAQTQASGMKAMGMVMKEVTAKAAGRAENQLVSELVKAKLLKT